MTTTHICCITHLHIYSTTFNRSVALIKSINLFFLRPSIFIFLFQITIALASIGVIYAGVIVDHHGYHIETKHGHHGGEGLSGAGFGFGGDFGGSYGGGYEAGYGGGDGGHHDYYVRLRKNISQFNDYKKIDFIGTS